MLPGVSFTPIQEFTISIGRIRYGWMDVTLQNKERVFEYRASYVSDPLNDILEVLVRGITGRGKKYPGEMEWSVLHDVEGELITWAFYFDNDHMHITIWKNIDIDLIDDIYFQRFDNLTWEYYQFTHEVKVDEDLLFAVEGPIIDFATYYKEFMEELGARKRKKDEFKDWGYRYSEEDFQKLKNYIGTYRLSGRK